MIILLTGTAGFIGFHAARRLLSEGHRVIGIDSLNDYYDVSLKYARLAELKSHENFEFYKVEISDHKALDVAAKDKGVTHILHLAAQAGVRYSLDNPRAYIQANVMGHLNILEFARHSGTVEHVAYASSSSVYGDREDGPFTETDKVRSPASLYAATKLGGEMLAESYQRLYGIPQTGLRFFTVYGPWGRPDMAYFIFTDKIMKGDPITLFAPDEMRRDFTYIDDIVDVLPKILSRPPSSGHEIYNLGNSKPNTLMQLVDAVEAACGRTGEKIILGKQNGDVSNTFADVSAAERDFGFAPKTDLHEGVKRFVEWYMQSSVS
ncbi:NAD-dependent epimerase/dehydratase family protein [Hellea balneolensis]|uniref:NAD-dependent epimerase/dehydratase family protein n=1 Tax=Hellea balneolensis TaxID=287478 RepID=UPI0003FAB048|nr:NAD-dependent epimerase/dehydratase family protein [Hellea balneolensis]